jgi:hypothetical protein
MNDIPRQLTILFSTFPPQPGELEAQIEAYGIALEGHDVQDIEAAIRRFIRGEVEGHNQSFPPTAAKLGAVVHECMHKRLDALNLEKRLHPRLPAPDIEHSPESIARVRAMVADLVPKLRTKDAADEVRKAAEQKRWQERMDARFIPDETPEAMKARLHIGDPEGDRDVA